MGTPPLSLAFHDVSSPQKFMPPEVDAQILNVQHRELDDLHFGHARRRRHPRLQCHTQPAQAQLPARMYMTHNFQFPPPDVSPPSIHNFIHWANKK
jgi:hypothetical protein